MDPLLGVIKADVGVKNGRIAGVGHGGNPLIQDGINSDMIVGAGTEVIAGEGMILTAGGYDSHIHFICPQQIEEALASGVTTMTGGEPVRQPGPTPRPARLVRGTLVRCYRQPMNFR